MGGIKKGPDLFHNDVEDLGKLQGARESLTDRMEELDPLPFDRIVAFEGEVRISGLAPPQGLLLENKGFCFVLKMPKIVIS